MADPIDLLMLNRKKKANPFASVGFDPWMYANNLVSGGPGAGGNAPSGAPSGAGGTGSTSTRSVTPDYNALLRGDPILGQLRSDLSAGGISDASQADAARQRAITTFGVPLDLNSLTDPQRAALGTLDPAGLATANTLAQKNTEAGLSIAARIRQAFDDRKRQELNALGARGAQRSGELGFALERQQLAFRQAQTDAAQQLMDTLAQIEQARASGDMERARALAQGAEQAATRLLQQYPVTTETVTAPAAPAAPSQPDNLYQPSRQRDILDAIMFDRRRQKLDMNSGLFG